VIAAAEPVEQEPLAPAEIEPAADEEARDPRTSVERVLRNLATTPRGLSEREASAACWRTARKILTRRRTRSIPGEVARQLLNPLALLLWAAAGLAWVSGTPPLNHRHRRRSSC
jgi:hypothetical protein